MWYLRSLFIFIALIILVLIMLIFPSIENDLILFARILLFGIITIALITIVVFSFWLREKFLILRAERKQKEHQTIQDGYGFIHLVNLANGHSQNLTLDARAYRNGHYEEPTNTELETFRSILMARHAASSKMIEQVALPATIEQKPKLDLLRIFTQPTQSYAIVGGQQVGKTFQAIRIANHWLQNGIKPIVIGPKWDKGEWANCTQFGGEYDFEKVSLGMQTIRKLAEDRHSDTTKSHKQHPLQPVFFDDWTAIRATLKEEAEDFVLDATTLYASVNIILYFIIHLDTGAAWGVDKVGASLKNNFIKLIIQPGYDDFGEIQRSKNIGWLIMPGQTIKDKQRIDLFSGNGSVLMLPDLVIQPKENLAQVEKENNDIKFVRLVSEGKSRNEAAQQAWGRRYAGDLVERGKMLLGEKVSTTT